MQKDVNADIERVLTQYRTVAIVGASDNPKRPSHRVAELLKGEGYRIIPVTPKAEKILGETAYPDLASIPVQVEVVDVFRRPEEVLPIAEEAIAVRAKVLWMQEGIINEEAATRAREAGLTVIMDRCMRKEVLRRLGREDEI
ncbi:MAG: CoA-binding protein [Dehalococcoidia bacterium]|nr:MAG: CoA-binding protein [Dehalococcoidia bacterium]